MSDITITQATVEDIATIKLIGRETFYEAFIQGNTEADMAKYLEETFNDGQVRKEFTNPETLFFIAWEDKTAVGYLKVNSGKAQTEIQDETALEIERIYVKSAYYGKKVGQLLYEKALEVAETKSKSYIWLGVWEENQRAISFYKKNGFVAFDKHIFRLGNDEQTDIMMKKALR